MSGCGNHPRKLKIFSGRSHPDLAEEICRIRDTPVGKSVVVRFSNENLMVQIKENVRGADVFVVQTSAPPVNEGLVELLITLDALKHTSADRITAVIPYFPYVRSDKKDKPRISITARLIADLLQTSGADRVLTMDLHAPQIQGFFRIPVDHLHATPVITEYLLNGDLSNAVLVAADAGEAKDVGRYANLLHLPMAIIDKRRHDDSEKATPTHLIGVVDGKDAIIIDDEVATGGTLVEAATFLKSHGARTIRAAFTHAVLSRDSVQRIDDSCIDEVIFTDTVPLQGKTSPKFKIVSVAEIFARAIRRIHDGDSLSELFR
ncbi:MAG: ribose-phosphate pyrophosphokinase [Candidatus Magasanikbacteria bacterium CG_4_10_14_0_2_um_filter_41_10]|uniref:ribose-phosphate diphosphokinase n=1 Tax=Candidatus Magasanikbacteria bacterium CG_4_10_14_0_2_um_filter_41_10 TaxID=1974638 RepID=A0A2M7V430_9BACT|nr:MAG: ribose-phosphate pyrophosphokinase [Candidatus Magasanikbacteria bacterium CG_4_10_14_0_2_um_filter_41_10]